ncbi:MAG: hypothetical protein U0794_02490 [Isosphaeraceae bacterium]
MIWTSMWMLLAATLTGQADGKPRTVNASQFRALLETTYEPISDVSFLYEGDVTFTGDPGLLKNMKPEDAAARFQFQFAYRRGGDLLIEGYDEFFGSRAGVNYRKIALRGHKLETVRVATDDPSRRVPVETTQGGVESLGGQRLPCFFFVPQLDSIRSPEELDYEFHGWEDVDNRRVLVVSLDKSPRRLNPGTTRRKFWIDVERGGHPLRVDVIDPRGAVVERFDQIRLKEFEVGPNQNIWMPVSGQVAGFAWNAKTYDSPVVTTTCSLVMGSLKANQKLGDRVFSASSPTRLPQTPALKRLQGRLHQQARTERPKTDPASVAADLDRRLTEANRQSDELMASAPSRGWDRPTLLLQTGAGALGLTCLALAILWSRR